MRGRKEKEGGDKDRETLGAGTEEKMKGVLGERWHKKQSDKPPQVDCYWVSLESISLNNIQVLLWLWWLFSLGCKRPAPFHAPTREAGKQARHPCVSLGYSSPSPLHHLSPTRNPVASQDMFCSSTAFDITWKTPFSLVCMCVSWMWVSLPACRPPSANRYRSLPTTQPGGPWAHTKHAFFFVSLMRNKGEREGERMFGRKKRWRDFSKRPQRIYLTGGERREKGSQETFWMWRQICAYGTALHPCYLSLPPDKQHYTTAGCCLSVMTTTLQISGCSQAQSRWLLVLVFACSGSVFHNWDVVTSHLWLLVIQAITSPLSLFLELLN